MVKLRSKVLKRKPANPRQVGLVRKAPGKPPPKNAGIAEAQPTPIFAAGPDPNFGFATPRLLGLTLDEIEHAAQAALRELLATTNHVQEDGAVNVLYALGWIQKIVDEAEDLRSRFESRGHKALAAAGGAS